MRSDPRFSAIDGAGLGVAVIDTGLDRTHSLLRGNYVAGFDFLDGDDNPNDPDGHGTHVAGTIGATDPAYGVAPAVDLIGLRVLGPEGGSLADIERALQWVIANQSAYNIVAVNMSLGGGFFSNPADPQLQGLIFADEIARLEQLGVTVVSAAGNSWKNSDNAANVAAPAILSTIAVGGVWEDGNPATASWASGAQEFSTGADRVMAMSQRLAFDRMLFAPGAVIDSTVPGNRIEGLAGTSMASPMVAGVVALVQDAALTFGGRLLTPVEVRELLISTADTIIDGDDEDDNVVNLGISFPRINAQRAVEAVLARFGGETPPPPGESGGDPNGTLATAIQGPVLGPSVLDNTGPDGSGRIISLGQRTFTEAVGSDGARNTGANDVDIYRFEVTVGGLVTVETGLGVGASADTVLRLFDASGAPIASNDDAPGLGGFSRLSVQLAPGVYHVGVSGKGNASYNPASDAGRSGGTVAAQGSYTLSFSLSGGDPNGVLPGAVAVNFVDDNTPVYFPGYLGADFGETVDTADVDLFEIVAPDDGRVFVNINTPYETFADTVIRLFDSDGAEVGRNDDALATDRFLRPIEFDTNPNIIGAIVVDQTNAAIGHNTDSFGWFDVQRGDRMFIGVSSFGNQEYDPTTVAGRPTATEFGFYDLFIQFINNDQNGSIAQAVDGSTITLAVGAPPIQVTGEIGTDGERDENGLRFDPITAQPIIITVGDRDVDMIRIVPSQSGLLEVDIDSFADSNSIDEALLPPSESPFGFEVDTVLKVFDGTGRELAFNDDDDGLDPRVVLPVEAGVPLFIAVTGYGNQSFDPLRLGSGPGGDTGRYTMTVRLLESAVLGSLSNNRIGDSQVTTLMPDTAVRGEVGRDGALQTGATDVDLYRFTPANSGNHRIFTETVDTFSADTFLRLFTEAGAEIAFNDDGPSGRSSEIITPLVGGQTYLIGVNGAGPDARDYNPLTGADAAAATGSLGPYVLTVSEAVGVVMGTDGPDRLVGTAGDDTIVAGAGNDVILALRGNNRIDLTGGGNNRVLTGTGADTIIGGAGDDVILAGRGGNNRIDLSAGGDNRVYGGDGADTVIGGAGRDVIRPGRGDDLIDLRAGGDNFVFNLRGDATIMGGAGDDVIRGGIGDTLIMAGGGNNRIVSGPGRDTIGFVQEAHETRLLDFRSGSDVMDFTGHDGVSGLGDLTLRQVGVNTIIDDGSGGRIVLAGLALDQIDQDDFLF